MNDLKQMKTEQTTFGCARVLNVGDRFQFRWDSKERKNFGIDLGRDLKMFVGRTMNHTHSRI